MAAGGSTYCPSYLILLLIMVMHPLVTAAPYLKTATGGSHIQQQQQPPLDHLFKPEQGLIGPLYRHNDYSMDPPTSGSCLYQLRHYEEGDRIITNEPCLNCTCHNSMLMCYLKVCPFSKPIGQDCKVEKSPNQCCPVITCPQVRVNLQVMQMTSTTTLSSTAASDPSSGLVPYSPHGCTIDNQYYPDGVQVPGNPREPCELCYCIRNHTTCIMQECVLKIPGCQPVFGDQICCPVRYSCEYDDYPEQAITTTTMTPNGTLLTTTLQPPEHAVGCIHNGHFYADGAEIPSENPCEHCYCMKADIICAIQECVSPLAEKDENCKPRPPLPGKCCPEAYDCLDAPISSSTQRDQETVEEEQETILEVADATTDSILESATSPIIYDKETQDPSSVETRTTKPELSEAATPIIKDLPYKESPERPLVDDETTQPDVAINLTTAFPSVKLPYISNITTNLPKITSTADKDPQTESPDIFVDTRTSKPEIDSDLKSSETTSIPLEGLTSVPKISSSPPSVGASTLIDDIPHMEFPEAHFNDTRKTQPDVDVDMPTDRTTASPFENVSHDTEVPIEYTEGTTSTKDYFDIVDLETRTTKPDTQLSTEKITTMTPELLPGIGDYTYTESPGVTSAITSTTKPDTKIDLTTASTNLSEIEPHFTKESIESGVTTSIDYIPEDATSSTDVVSSFKPEILESTTTSSEDDSYTETTENVLVYTTTIQPSTYIDLNASKTTQLPLEILPHITRGSTISPIADTPIDDDFPFSRYPEKVSVDTRTTPETEVTTSKVTITPAHEVNATEESFPVVTTRTDDIYHTGPPDLISTDHSTAMPDVGFGLTPSITTESPDEKLIHTTEALESVTTIHDFSYTESSDAVSFDTSTIQRESASHTTTLKTTETSISKVSNTTTLSPHFPETSSIDDEYYTESSETFSNDTRTGETETDMDVSTFMVDTIPDHELTTAIGETTEIPPQITQAVGDIIYTESPEIVPVDVKTTQLSSDFTPTTLTAITIKEVLPDVGKVTTELTEAINITVEEFPYTESPEGVINQTRTVTKSDDLLEDQEAVLGETSTIQQDIDIKSTTSRPTFLGVEVEQHLTTASQEIDILKESKTNITSTDASVDTRYTQATELPEFDITKLETEISETTEAAIIPAADLTPGRKEVTSELPISDGIRSHYTTVTLESEIEKTTSSIDETPLVTKLPIFDTQEPIDEKYVISALPTGILKPFSKKSPGDVSVGPEVEIDAITFKPTIDIFELETIPKITTKQPVIDDGKTQSIRDETSKAATVTSIPTRDESLSQVEFTTDILKDIETTTKKLPPSRETTEDLSFGLDSVIKSEDESMDSQILPNVTQVAAVSTTDATRADGLYTESPLTSDTQTIQSDIYVDITTSKTTSTSPVKLPDGTKLSPEFSPAHRNVTHASISEVPEEYLTTTISEYIPSEVTKSDYVTAAILKDDGKEIMETPTTITSIRDSDQTVTELPIISGYPEYKPSPKPEILDYISPEVTIDSIDLDSTTESVEFVTKSSSMFDKIGTTHEEQIKQTETTLSGQSITDFEQKMTTHKAIPLTHVYISENTTQDIKFDVTSTIAIKIEEKDGEVETTTIESDSPILADFDDQTTTEKLEVSSAETTLSFEASTTPQKPPKIPSIQELSTMDPSKVTHEIEKIYPTTIRSTVKDELLIETTESPIKVQEFTDRLPSEIDVTTSDDTFDSLVTTPGKEISSPSSPAIDLIDAIPTEESDVDSPEQRITESEATTIGPRQEFTSQAGLTMQKTSTMTEEEERPDRVTILQEYITTASPISPHLIKCDQVTCQPPPPTFLGCRERKTTEDCCPFYDCPVIFPDDEFRPTTFVSVTLQPEHNITLSEETELAKNFTTIKPTTFSVISEEKITEQIPQDDKRPILEPEIMDQTIIKTKDEDERLPTPYYEHTIDLIQTTPFSETVTKSSVMADHLEEEKRTDIELKLGIAPVNVSDQKDDTVEMTTKIFGDVEKRITSSTLLVDIEDVSVTTPTLQTVKDTDSPTTVLETVREMYQTTTSSIDKPVDKVELFPPKDSKVTESTSEPDQDIIAATTRRMDYEESSLPSIKAELDQTTVQHDFSDSTYVTETSVHKKIISNITEEILSPQDTEKGDSFMYDVESSTQKTSTSISDKTVSSLSEIDSSVTTKIPDMIEETSVKMSSMSITPAVKDEETVTLEITDDLPIITERPTDDNVTQKHFVDKTTSPETMAITEDPEIKATYIVSTDQPLAGVTIDGERDEIRDGVTAMKPEVTSSREVTAPSLLSFSTDYTTLSSSLSVDELATHKIDTYPVESASMPQFSEMEVTTSSTLADDHFMETKPFDEKTGTTDGQKEIETTGAPGEGLCTYNGKIYSNGESVPVSSQCQKECRCSHSVISCKAIKCSQPPPTFLRCEVRQTSNECCPFYECPIHFPPGTESESTYDPSYKPELDLPGLTAPVATSTIQTTIQEDFEFKQSYEQTLVPKSPSLTEMPIKITRKMIPEIATYQPDSQVKETTPNQTDTSFDQTKKYTHHKTTLETKDQTDIPTTEATFSNTRDIKYSTTTTKEKVNVDESTLVTRNIYDYTHKNITFDTTEKTKATTAQGETTKFVRGFDVTEKITIPDYTTRIYYINDTTTQVDQLDSKTSNQTRPYITTTIFIDESERKLITTTTEYKTTTREGRVTEMPIAEIDIPDMKFTHLGIIEQTTMEPTIEMQITTDKPVDDTNSAVVPEFTTVEKEDTTTDKTQKKKTYAIKETTHPEEQVTTKVGEPTTYMHIEDETTVASMKKEITDLETIDKSQIATEKTYTVTTREVITHKPIKEEATVASMTTEIPELVSTETSVITTDITYTEKPDYVDVPTTIVPFLRAKDETGPNMTTPGVTHLPLEEETIPSSTSLPITIPSISTELDLASSTRIPDVVSTSLPIGEETVETLPTDDSTKITPETIDPMEIVPTTPPYIDTKFAEEEKHSTEKSLTTIAQDKERTQLTTRTDGPIIKEIGVTLPTEAYQTLIAFPEEGSPEVSVFTSPKYAKYPTTTQTPKEETKSPREVVQTTKEERGISEETTTLQVAIESSTEALNQTEIGETASINVTTSRITPKYENVTTRFPDITTIDAVTEIQTIEPLEEKQSTPYTRVLSSDIPVTTKPREAVPYVSLIDETTVASITTEIPELVSTETSPIKTDITYTEKPDYVKVPTTIVPFLRAKDETGPNMTTPGVTHLPLEEETIPSSTSLPITIPSISTELDLASSTGIPDVVSTSLPIGEETVETLPTDDSTKITHETIDPMEIVPTTPPYIDTTFAKEEKHSTEKSLTTIAQDKERTQLTTHTDSPILKEIGVTLPTEAYQTLIAFPEEGSPKVSVFSSPKYAKYPITTETPKEETKSSRKVVQTTTAEKGISEETTTLQVAIESSTEAFIQTEIGETASINVTASRITPKYENVTTRFPDITAMDVVTEIQTIEPLEEKQSTPYTGVLSSDIPVTTKPKEAKPHVFLIDATTVASITTKIPELVSTETSVITTDITYTEKPDYVDVPTTIVPFLRAKDETGPNMTTPGVTHLPLEEETIPSSTSLPITIPSISTELDLASSTRIPDVVSTSLPIGEETVETLPTDDSTKITPETIDPMEIAPTTPPYIDTTFAEEEKHSTEKSLTTIAQDKERTQLTTHTDSPIIKEIGVTLPTEAYQTLIAFPEEGSPEVSVFTSPKYAKYPTTTQTPKEETKSPRKVVQTTKAERGISEETTTLQVAIESSTEAFNQTEIGETASINVTTSRITPKYENVTTRFPDITTMDAVTEIQTIEPLEEKQSTPYTRVLSSDIPVTTKPREAVPHVSLIDETTVASITTEIPELVSTETSPIKTDITYTEKPDYVEVPTTIVSFLRAKDETGPNMTTPGVTHLPLEKETIPSSTSLQITIPSISTELELASSTGIPDVVSTSLPIGEETVETLPTDDSTKSTHKTIDPLEIVPTTPPYIDTTFAEEEKHSTEKSLTTIAQDKERTQLTTHTDSPIIKEIGVTLPTEAYQTLIAFPEEGSPEVSVFTSPKYAKYPITTETPKEETKSSRKVVQTTTAEKGISEETTTLQVAIESSTEAFNQTEIGEIASINVTASRITPKYENVTTRFPDITAMDVVTEIQTIEPLEEKQSTPYTGVLSSGIPVTTKPREAEPHVFLIDATTVASITTEIPELVSTETSVITTDITYTEKPDYVDVPTTIVPFLRAKDETGPNMTTPGDTHLPLEEETIPSSTSLPITIPSISTELDSASSTGIPDVVSTSLPIGEETVETLPTDDSTKITHETIDSVEIVPTTPPYIDTTFAEEEKHSTEKSQTTIAQDKERTQLTTRTDSPIIKEIGVTLPTEAYQTLIAFPKEGSPKVSVFTTPKYAKYPTTTETPKEETKYPQKVVQTTTAGRGISEETTTLQVAIDSSTEAFNQTEIGETASINVTASRKTPKYENVTTRFSEITTIEAVTEIQTIEPLEEKQSTPYTEVLSSDIPVTTKQREAVPHVSLIDTTTVASITTEIPELVSNETSPITTDITYTEKPDYVDVSSTIVPFLRAKDETGPNMTTPGVTYLPLEEETLPSSTSLPITIPSISTELDLASSTGIPDVVSTSLPIGDETIETLSPYYSTKISPETVDPVEIIPTTPDYIEATFTDEAKHSTKKSLPTISQEKEHSRSTTRTDSLIIKELGVTLPSGAYLTTQEDYVTIVFPEESIPKVPVITSPKYVKYPTTSETPMEESKYTQKVVQTTPQVSVPEGMTVSQVTIDSSTDYFNQTESGERASIFVTTSDVTPLYESVTTRLPYFTTKDAVTKIHTRDPLEEKESTLYPGIIYSDTSFTIKSRTEITHKSLLNETTVASITTEIPELVSTKTAPIKTEITYTEKPDYVDVPTTIVPFLRAKDETAVNMTTPRATDIPVKEEAIPSFTLLPITIPNIFTDLDFARSTEIPDMVTTSLAMGEETVETLPPDYSTLEIVHTMPPYRNTTFAEEVKPSTERFLTTIAQDKERTQFTTRTDSPITKEIGVTLTTEAYQTPISFPEEGSPKVSALTSPKYAKYPTTTETPKEETRSSQKVVQTTTAERGISEETTTSQVAIYLSMEPFNQTEIGDTASIDVTTSRITPMYESVSTRLPDFTTMDAVTKIETVEPLEEKQSTPYPGFLSSDIPVTTQPKEAVTHVSLIAETTVASITTEIPEFLSTETSVITTEITYTEKPDSVDVPSKIYPDLREKEDTGLNVTTSRATDLPLEEETIPSSTLLPITIPSISIELDLASRTEIPDVVSTSLPIGEKTIETLSPYYSTKIHPETVDPLVIVPTTLDYKEATFAEEAKPSTDKSLPTIPQEKERSRSTTRTDSSILNKLGDTLTSGEYLTTQEDYVTIVFPEESIPKVPVITSPKYVKYPTTSETPMEESKYTQKVVQTTPQVSVSEEMTVSQVTIDSSTDYFNQTESGERASIFVTTSDVTPLYENVTTRLPYFTTSDAATKIHTRDPLEEKESTLYPGIIYSDTPVTIKSREAVTKRFLLDETTVPLMTTEIPDLVSTETSPIKTEITFTEKSDYVDVPTTIVPHLREDNETEVNMTIPRATDLPLEEETIPSFTLLPITIASISADLDLSPSTEIPDGVTTFLPLGEEILETLSPDNSTKISSETIDPLEIVPTTPDYIEATFAEKAKPITENFLTTIAREKGSTQSTNRTYSPITKEFGAPLPTGAYQTSPEDFVTIAFPEERMPKVPLLTSPKYAKYPTTSETPTEETKYTQTVVQTTTTQVSVSEETSVSQIASESSTEPLNQTASGETASVFVTTSKITPLYERQSTRLPFFTTMDAVTEIQTKEPLEERKSTTYTGIHFSDTPATTKSREAMTHKSLLDETTFASMTTKISDLGSPQSSSIKTEITYTEKPDYVDVPITIVPHLKAKVETELNISTPRATDILHDEEAILSSTLLPITIPSISTELDLTPSTEIPDVVTTSLSMGKVTVETLSPDYPTKISPDTVDPLDLVPTTPLYIHTTFAEKEKPSTKKSLTPIAKVKESTQLTTRKDSETPFDLFSPDHSYITSDGYNHSTTYSSDVFSSTHLPLDIIFDVPKGSVITEPHQEVTKDDSIASDMITDIPSLVPSTIVDFLTTKPFSKETSIEPFTDTTTTQTDDLFSTSFEKTVYSTPASTTQHDISFYLINVSLPNITFDHEVNVSLDVNFTLPFHQYSTKPIIYAFNTTQFPADIFTDTHITTTTTSTGSDTTVDISTYTPQVTDPELPFVAETTKTTEDRKDPAKTTELITEKPHADDPKMPLGTPAPELSDMSTLVPDDAVTKSPILKDKPILYTESPTSYPPVEAETTTEKSEDFYLLATEKEPENITTKFPVFQNISIQYTTETILDIYTTSPEETDIEGLTKSKLDLEEDLTTSKPFITTVSVSKPSEEGIFMDCVTESYFFKHGELTSYKDKCRDNCKCNDGKFECEQRSCSPPPPLSLGISCTLSRMNDSCCPNYECQAITGDICFYEGKAYEDGQEVFSSQKCTSCFCIRGEVKCTSQQCKAPHAHCRPLAHGNDECCPSLYTCTEGTFPPTKPLIEDLDAVKITTIASIEKTAKPAISEAPITIESTTPKVLYLTEEMITEILSNLTTTPTPPSDESASKVTPKETIPEDIVQKVEPHFPEFPGLTDQSYLGPYHHKTTTKAPATTAAEIILSPGSCLFDGKPYVSAQQIPRDNPCDFCFCFRGDIICLQQSCPPPIPGCYEEAIPGFCCPRYECPVQKTVMNVTTTTPSPFPGFPAISKTSRVNMCEIEGQYYASGARVTAASNPCLDCMCGDDGSLKCSPRECPANRKIYTKNTSR